MEKESTGGEKDSVGRCTRLDCHKPSWESHSICYWKALTDLFQSDSDHRKLALKDKLRKIRMEKNNTILVYLTKFVQWRDELGSVGVSVADDDLVILALLGLPKSWHSYEDYVYGREKLSD